MTFARAVLLAALIAAGPFVEPASAADAFASDWSASSKSRARLIADGAGGAGLEIELAPGAITYWRDPGEAGLPPAFDFAGSQNVAGAEVLFPAPARIHEPDGSTANGYRERVVLPIRLTLANPAKATTLKVNVNYAVCERVCLPARANLSLAMPVGISSPYGAALAAARAETPRKIGFAELGGEIAAQAPNTWRLCVPASADGPPELFLEPPAGAWLEAKADTAPSGKACYTLFLRDPPLDAAARLVVFATLVGAKDATETSFDLPKS